MAKHKERPGAAQGDGSVTGRLIHGQKPFTRAAVRRNLRGDDGTHTTTTGVAAMITSDVHVTNQSVSIATASRRIANAFAAAAAALVLAVTASAAPALALEDSGGVSPADRGYEFVPETDPAAGASGRFVADNAAQGFRGLITGTGVSLAGHRDGEASWEATLQLTAFGSGSSHVPVEIGAAHRSGRTLHVALDALTASWTHSPSALSLAVDVSLLRAERAHLDFSLSGDLVARPSATTSAATLVAPGAQAALRLQVTEARGADGRRLNARIAIDATPIHVGAQPHQRLRILLEDAENGSSGIASPVTVVLELARNAEARFTSGAALAPSPATCGLEGSVTPGGSDRHVLASPDAGWSPLVLVQGDGGGAGPRLSLVPGTIGTIGIEPARTETPATLGATTRYHVDWMARRPLGLATTETEPNDDAGRANAGANDLFQGRLASADDRDWYRVSAELGDRVMVAAEVLGIDPGIAIPPGILITVRDADGKVVASARANDPHRTTSFQGAATAFWARARGILTIEIALEPDASRPGTASNVSYALSLSRNCDAAGGASPGSRSGTRCRSDRDGDPLCASRRCVRRR